MAINPAWIRGPNTTNTTNTNSPHSTTGNVVLNTSSGSHTHTWVGDYDPGTGTFVVTDTQHPLSSPWLGKLAAKANLHSLDFISGFTDIYCSEVEDTIYTFVVNNGTFVVLEDNKDNFPSDHLMHQLTLLRS